MTQVDKYFDPYMVVKPIAAVLSLWIVFWVEHRWFTDFTSYGLYPRSIRGLLGVITSPFIHSGLSHLWGNTVPIAVLLFFLQSFYSRLSNEVLLYGTMITGILTWLIARNAYHIGASGVIYMLASFIFFKGLTSSNYRQMSASLIVVFLYGSLVWYVLPIESSISWEGHLCGAMAGVLLAFALKSPSNYRLHSGKMNQRPLSKEETWFMMQFDQEGNFSPLPPELREELDEIEK